MTSCSAKEAGVTLGAAERCGKNGGKSWEKTGEHEKTCFVGIFGG